MISLKKVPQAIYCFIFLLVYYVKKFFALSKNLNNLSYQKNEIQESLEIKLLFETKKNKAKKEKDQIEKLVEELMTNDNDQSTKENLLVTLLQNNYQQQINHKACFINEDEDEDEEEENENEKENLNINNFKNKEIEIEIENENKNENKNEKEKEKEKKKQTKPHQNKTDLLFFRQQFGVNGKEKKQLSRWLHLKKLIDPMLNYIFKNIKSTTGGGSVINYNKWYKELERSNQEEEEQQKKKIEKRSLLKKKTKQETMEEQQTHFFQRLQQQRSQYFTKKNLKPYNKALMEEINSLKTFRLDLHLSSEMQDLILGDEIRFFQNCINNLTINFDKQCIFFYYFNFQQIGKQIYEQVLKIITDYETKFKSKLKLDNDFK
ncbi:hypothetical protein M0813_00515 [Anaeramoeba flamelloides]|uniref:Transmembrane protein n=1 Tax=Anaeramoeba flamelloides TaxID=1746091 RepID=A0ABQ8YB60_9EUKA|nr:hypothetical protein M0813_00515 [Anaeramoeba flamelloides]